MTLGEKGEMKSETLFTQPDERLFKVPNFNSGRRVQARPEKPRIKKEEGGGKKTQVEMEGGGGQGCKVWVRHRVLLSFGRALGFEGKQQKLGKKKRKTGSLVQDDRVPRGMNYLAIQKRGGDTFRKTQSGSQKASA